ncbi:MAG: chemotaxis protein CheW [Gammaproteobacteria bacterium]|nr:chemotaxis protein CheW [Gammaproteobacteria bacterium]
MDSAADAHGNGSQRPQMPQTQRQQQLLQRRARQLAQVGSGALDGRYAIELGARFLEVKIGNGRYGIPYHWLCEVIHDNGLTRVPGTVEWIAGTMARRGELITIIDLALLLEGSATAAVAGARRMVAVVVEEDFSFGLLLEDVVGSSSYFYQTLTASLRHDTVVMGIHNGEVAIIDIAAVAEKLNQTV